MTTARRRLYRGLTVLISDNETDSRGDVDAPSPPSSGFGCALARSRGKRLDVARRGSRAPAVPVRPFASVRRRAAPRYRSRRFRGLARARARGGDGELRRHGPVLGEERHHRDARRVLGHAHASRLDQRGREHRRRRRQPRRHDRPEQRRRGLAALHPSRCAPDRAGSGVSGSSDAAAAAGRCSAGRACARPDPSACFTAGIRARSGLTPRSSGRRRCAVGHVHSRAVGFARARSRATARPGDRFAACGRRGGIGRGACRRGTRPRGPTRGGRRTGAQGHGDEAHRSAGSCAAGRCAALLDGHARSDARSRAVDSPRCVGTWLEHDRCPRALPGSREWRTGAGLSPARATSELVPACRERSPRPDRREPRAAGSAAPACTESRCRSGRGGAYSAPGNSPLGPRRLSPRASARPRGDGTRGEAAKGRAYHCSRCAST